MQRAGADTTLPCIAVVGDHAHHRGHGRVCWCSGMDRDAAIGGQHHWRVLGLRRLAAALHRRPSVALIAQSATGMEPLMTKAINVHRPPDSWQDAQVWPGSGMGLAYHS